MKKVCLIILGLALMACAAKDGATTTTSTPAKSKSGVTENDLLHHRFVLKTYNGAEVKAVNFSKIPGIEFQEGMRIGGVMCNNYNGPAKFENGKLQATVASTMMLCMDDINRVEHAFFTALREGADVKLSGNTLQLKHASDTFVFELDDYK